MENNNFQPSSTTPPTPSEPNQPLPPTPESDFNNIPTAPTNPTPTPPTTPIQPAPKPKSKKWLIISIISVCALALITGALVLVLTLFPSPKKVYQNALENFIANPKKTSETSISLTSTDTDTKLGLKINETMDDNANWKATITLDEDSDIAAYLDNFQIDLIFNTKDLTAYYRFNGASKLLELTISPLIAAIATTNINNSALAADPEAVVDTDSIISTNPQLVAFLNGIEQLENKWYRISPADLTELATNFTSTTELKTFSSETATCLKNTDLTTSLNSLVDKTLSDLVLVERVPLEDSPIVNSEKGTIYRTALVNDSTALATGIVSLLQDNNFQSYYNCIAPAIAYDIMNIASGNQTSQKEADVFIKDLYTKLTNTNTWKQNLTDLPEIPYNYVEIVNNYITRNYSTISLEKYTALTIDQFYHYPDSIQTIENPEEATPLLTMINDIVTIITTAFTTDPSIAQS